MTAGPPAAAQNTFNGLYAGLTTGYGWGTSAHSGLSPTAGGPILYDCGDNIFVTDPRDCNRDAKLRPRGGLVGGALGWNAQYGGWIFGVETDYSYAAVSAESNTCGTVPCTCGSRLESLGTVRGRVGTLVNDWMLYATGGFAYGRISGFDITKSAGQEMYSGWTMGAGIEKRFAPQWSLKLEYLYTDLGSKELFQAPVPGFPEHVAFKLSTLRLGISYFFEPAVAPAPMIVKGPSLK